MKLAKADLVYQIFIYACVGALVLISFFPLVYVVSLSLVSEAEWNASLGTVFIPMKPTLSAYRSVLMFSQTILQGLKVSVFRTVVGTIVGIFFTMCTGYVLSRKDIPFKKAMILMVMVTILFHGGLIPTFLVVVNTGFYDSIWALIILRLVDSWSVLVFKQFFENTPDSIEESARLDGASEISIMWLIVVPLSKAVIAALSLFMAVGHWNSWFDAAVYIKDADLKPLQLLLRNLFVNANVGFDLQQGGGAFMDEESAMLPVSIRMCITVLCTIPILCVYPFLQKYFTKGVYVGSVKG